MQAPGNYYIKELLNRSSGRTPYSAFDKIHRCQSSGTGSVSNLAIMDAEENVYLRSVPHRLPCEK